MNPEWHAGMPVQETNSLFKANVTAALITSGTPEKQGSVLPLCRTKAPSICFAQSNISPISYYTASCFFNKTLLFLDL